MPSGSVAIEFSPEELRTLESVVGAAAEKLSKSIDRLTPGHPLHTRALERYDELNGLSLRLLEADDDA